MSNNTVLGVKMLSGFTILFIFMAVAIVSTSYKFTQDLLRLQIVQLGETSNIVLAQSFAGTLWPLFGEYIQTVEETDGDVLRSRPETAELRKIAAELAQDKPVLKLKIYNLAGVTIYSSQESQIGESKIGNRGYESAAKQGIPVSKMSERGRFSSFSEVLSNVALAETYVPVFNDAGQIEGVFELYTDVSPIFFTSQEQLRQLIIALVALCIVAYILFLAGLFLLRERAGSKTSVADIKAGFEQRTALKQQLQSMQQQMEFKDQELKALRQRVATR